MNTKINLLVLAAFIAACFSTTSTAQEKEAGIVAVLDVAKVFKENEAFNAQMEAIKAEADRLKEQIQADQQRIQNDARAVLEKEIGTNERNQMETEIEKRQAELRTRARQLEIDLLTREAKIYHETYETMKTVVESLAGANNISLVLRFDSSPINSDNRAEVISGVNRTVVFHDHLDLTKLVVDGMKKTATAGMGINQK